MRTAKITTIREGEGMLKAVVIGLMAYDLAIHVAHLIRPREWWIEKKLVFWPIVYEKNYDKFWSIYWLVALICAIVAFKDRSPKENVSRAVNEAEGEEALV